MCQSSFSVWQNPISFGAQHLSLNPTSVHHAIRLSKSVTKSVGVFARIFQTIQSNSPNHIMTYDAVLTYIFIPFYHRLVYIMACLLKILFPLRPYYSIRSYDLEFPVSDNYLKKYQFIKQYTEC